VAYVTLPEFTTYVGSEIAANQPDLAIALAAAEATINEHCQRCFDVAAVTSITRRYVPESSTVVRIHDIADNTNLVVTDDGTTVAAADFQLEPLNGLLKDGTVTAYHTLRRINGSSWMWGGREATVSVTSTRWGWVAVPAKVKEATLVLAKDFAALKDTRFGVAGWGEFGVVRMRENPQVMFLLRNLEHPDAVLVH
jgi:hypothetical protein